VALSMAIVLITDRRLFETVYMRQSIVL